MVLYVDDQDAARVFGAELREARIRAGLRQADLAERAGVSTRTIHQIEADGSARWLNLIAVLRALNLFDQVLEAVVQPESSPVDDLDSAPVRARQRVRTETAGAIGDWRWGDGR
ncbi:MAG: transcriptional regulator with XRE-family HTH domain [Verrucomicrobiales bacterium]|jgi:transcriptional regulator with XRE-family HTH domain